MTANIKKYISAESLRSFYMGKIYPIVICVLVALGSISGLEFYFGFIHVAMFCGALVISDSVKPIMISLITFVMQASVVHSPFYPNYSDYYYTGWRLPCIVVFAIALFFGFVTFVVRNKLYLKISLRKTPLLLPLIILSVAFILNGVFSGKWTIGNLWFGVANVAVYLFAFLLIYHGFSDSETAEDSAGYFSYISVLVSAVVTIELIALYLTSDNIFINGTINKVGVALGWGIWNLVGVSLSVLIPVIFYGMHKNKYPWLYFASATVTYIAAVLTMSRNAFIFSTLAYAACVLISCFVGKQKRTFRIITAAGIAAAVLLVIVFFDKIYLLLGDYFERGLSDNGRYALWRAAFENFLKSPVFGGGFYGFAPENLDPFGPLAKQAHNTVLQLLSATGIFGFAAYFYYRFKTATEIIKRPSFLKIMLSLSIAVLLLESLLDNFIFNIYPMFYYNVALAIICRANRHSHN